MTDLKTRLQQITAANHEQLRASSHTWNHVAELLTNSNAAMADAGVRIADLEAEILRLTGKLWEAAQERQAWAGICASDAAAAKQIGELTADRDAAWRMARAAAEGHDRCRAELDGLKESYRLAEDPLAELKAAIARGGARRTAAVKRLDAALAQVVTPVDLPVLDETELFSHDTLDKVVDRACEILRSTHGALMSWRRWAESKSDLLGVDAGFLSNEPLQAALDGLVNPGRERVRLLERALATAGAPLDGDLEVWASDVRNTIAGLRADLEEATISHNANGAARRHELNEFRAACSGLPFPFVARDVGTPIAIFMAMREQAIGWHKAACAHLEVERARTGRTESDAPLGTLIVHVDAHTHTMPGIPELVVMYQPVSGSIVELLRRRLDSSRNLPSWTFEIPLRVNPAPVAPVSGA